MNSQHSYLVGILPFVEQQAIWEMISNHLSRGVVAAPSTPFNAFGPTPALEWSGTNRSAFNYIPNMTSIGSFRCPSDPGNGLPSQGRTNYAACLGDGIHRVGPGITHGMNQGPVFASGTGEEVRASMRGVFIPNRSTNFRDVLDGLSNTLCAGELATDLGDKDTRTDPAISAAVAAFAVNTGDIDACDGRIDSARPQFWGSAVVVSDSATTGPQRVRGYMWAGSYTVISGFQAIRPPNKPVCIESSRLRNGLFADGVLLPSSRHQGGCHVLMTDGAVKFITDSIDSGNQQSSTVRRGNTSPAAPVAGQQSPFGLWGALGTRANKETIDQES